MKRILKMTAFAFVLVLGSVTLNRAVAQDYQDDYYEDDYYEDDYYGEQGDVSYETFYDELSPHGNWIEYPGHGYVWQPRMSNDFRPYYSGGHWVWNDRHGWVWVSDYDWGWAPFHYGRWFQDPYYGWLWVPGYEWSGAWVTWRDGGDYYGWAPIRPGISININFNIGGYHPPVDWWVFTPRRYILYRNVHNHCIDYRRNVTIIHNTTIINNYHYGDRYGFRAGPRRMDFERYTGRINPVRFRQSSQPGRSTFRDNEVSIYRPNVRRDNDRVAPRNFERFDRNTANNRTQGTGNPRVRENGEGNTRDFRSNRNRENEVRPNNTNTPRENRSFDRRRQEPREISPNRNNAPTERRRFEREDAPRDQQIRTQREQRPSRTVDPGNNNGRFERNRPPMQQPRERTMERRQESPMRQQQPRQIERRTEPQQPRQFERRSAPEQNRQVDRSRSENTNRSGSAQGGNNGRRRF
jgi:hypothetical protein